MMDKNKTLLSFGVILLLVTMYSSIYVVKESRQALLLRLGKIVGTETKIAKNPGLHFKIPFIDQVRMFDVKIQGLESKKLQVITRQKTYLNVRYYARWRITDLAKFYTSTGSNVSWIAHVNRAESLLEQDINDALRAEIGRHASDELISTDRNKIVAVTKEQTNRQALQKNRGVRLIDIKILDISLPDTILKSVFERMSAERKQFAEQKRADGKKEAEAIRARADEERVVLEAEADSKAATIKAKGDKIAAAIYAKAYNANPKFYEFYKSLEGYNSSFNSKRDILVLQPDGEFFKYFKSSTDTKR